MHYLDKTPERASLLNPPSGGGAKVKRPKQPEYLSTQMPTKSNNGCPNPDSPPISTKEPSSEILMRWARSVMGYKQTYSALPTNNPVPKTDLNTKKRIKGVIETNNEILLTNQMKKTFGDKFKEMESLSIPMNEELNQSISSILKKEFKQNITFNDQAHLHLELIISEDKQIIKSISGEFKLATNMIKSFSGSYNIATNMIFKFKIKVNDPTKPLEQICKYYYDNTEFLEPRTTTFCVMDDICEGIGIFSMINYSEKQLNRTRAIFKGHTNYLHTPSFTIETDSFNSIVNGSYKAAISDLAKSTI